MAKPEGLTVAALQGTAAVPQSPNCIPLTRRCAKGWQGVGIKGTYKGPCTQIVDTLPSKYLY